MGHCREEMKAQGKTNKTPQLHRDVLLPSLAQEIAQDYFSGRFALRRKAREGVNPSQKHHQWKINELKPCQDTGRTKPLRKNKVRVLGAQDYNNIPLL